MSGRCPISRRRNICALNGSLCWPQHMATVWRLRQQRGSSRGCGVPMVRTVCRWPFWGSETAAFRLFVPMSPPLRLPPQHRAGLCFCRSIRLTASHRRISRAGAMRSGRRWGWTFNWSTSRFYQRPKPCALCRGQISGPRCSPLAILRFALPRATVWQRLTGQGFARCQAGDLIGILPENSPEPSPVAWYYSLAPSAPRRVHRDCGKKAPWWPCVVPTCRDGAG